MISKVFARIFAFLTTLVLCAGVAGCKSEPPKPGEAEFDAANARIATFDTEVGFGSDATATAWAKKTSALLKKLEAESFEGGKDDEKDAITKGNFLVYCHTQGNDIVFLVQAPNLDTYKGDVRKTLFEIAWEATQEAIGSQPGKNVVIAMRGKLLYGVLGSGKAGGKVPEPKLDTAIDVALLHPHFIPGGAAPAASAAAAPPAPAAASSAK